MPTSSYSLAPGATSEDISLRRKLAAQLIQQGTDTSPVDHWTQGLARAVQGGLGGYELGQIRREEGDEKDAGRKALIAMLGGDAPQQPSQNPLGPVTPGPRPASAPPASAVPGREHAGGVPIYNQDEANPLDVPMGEERDRLIRTVYGEAGNQPAVGQQAVANVVRNRAVSGRYGGDTVSGVVGAPNQFEPWNTPGGRARMASLSPDDPMYRQIDSTIDRAYAGDDPTSGATHFFSPTAQAALGRPVPKWGQGTGQDIGGHRFFQLGNNGAGATPPVQMASAGSPQSLPQMPQGGAPAAPAAPPQQPQMGSSAAQPQITPQQRAQLTTLLGNKFTAPMGEQMATALIQRGLMPTDPKFEKVKAEDGSEVPVWVNSRDQSVRAAQMPQAERPAGSVIPPVPPGVDPKEWRKQHSTRLTEESLPAGDQRVQSVRKEVQDLPSYKNLAQAAPVYRSMLEAAGRDNRAADVNLIYGMAKIMDPGSVVRESEMTVAQAIATLPQGLAAQIKSQLAATGRLDPRVRADLMREAHGRIQAYNSMFGQDTKMYEGIATRGRMNRDDVIPNFGDFQQHTPPAPPAGPTGGAAAPRQAAPPGQTTGPAQGGAAPRAKNAQGHVIEWNGQQWVPTQ